MTTRGARARRTKASILDAARARFAAEGFERTTIRAIARDAQIDPSMVMRYFGDKRRLFVAAAEFDLALPDLTHVPGHGLGRIVVEHFLSRWEGDRVDDSLRVLLATAVTDPTAAEQMHEILRAQLAPVVAAAGPHEPTAAATRAGLVATQMLGFALCRYVLRLPPVVELRLEDAVHWLSPVIQRYLSADDTHLEGRAEGAQTSHTD